MNKNGREIFVKKFIILLLMILIVIEVFTTKVVAEEYSKNTNNTNIQEDIVINEITFPDQSFRDYVLLMYDHSKDGMLSLDERNRVDMMHLSSEGIKNLKGIEYFVNATYINVMNNELEDADFSYNRKLQKLYIRDNKLKSININKNKDLEILEVLNNQLKVLDVRNNINLKRLYCNNNLLTSLDVSKNVNLTTLIIDKNDIQRIDLSNNLELGIFTANYCELSQIDIGMLTKLYRLSLYDNHLSSIDVTNNPLLERIDGRKQTLHYTFTYNKERALWESEEAVFDEAVIFSNPELNFNKNTSRFEISNFDPGIMTQFQSQFTGNNGTIGQIQPLGGEITFDYVNEIPEIFANNREVKLGEEFQALNGVKAFDIEDGDITNNIIVKSNTVDVNQVGEYEVTYEVRDSANASVEKTIKVKVVGNDDQVNKLPPLIEAEDKVIQVGDVFDPLKGVYATDVKDGVISDKVVVVSSNVNPELEGVYQVTYRVTNSDGLSTQKTIKVFVKAKMNSGSNEEGEDTNSNGTHTEQDSSFDSPNTGTSLNIGMLYLIFVSSLYVIVRLKKFILK